jgi:hypothetical protein
VCLRARVGAARSGNFKIEYEMDTKESERGSRKTTERKRGGRDLGDGGTHSGCYVNAWALLARDTPGLRAKDNVQAPKGANALSSWMDAHGKPRGGFV